MLRHQEVARRHQIPHLKNPLWLKTARGDFSNYHLCKIFFIKVRDVQNLIFFMIVFRMKDCQSTLLYLFGFRYLITGEQRRQFFIPIFHAGRDNNSYHQLSSPPRNFHCRFVSLQALITCQNLNTVAQVSIIVYNFNNRSIT